ncbi:arginine ABC transporter permease ArtM [Candidatus Palibaumannia cicadellinicola]|uniref:Arginine ABC transporter permease protein ArtM n=1 Tax=Candidatus Palibaumannia cicadellinicola TaxID=186490 RepID=A0A0K2BKL1_9GAMM|nr:arginine ABC transporter permease ArtM [Candidatus Baumannia cicadellinicola]AKZ65870.1 Arginine ABC transporter, permease protein [Candidatus Baumannia cicadellinicola]
MFSYIKIILLGLPTSLILMLISIILAFLLSLFFTKKIILKKNFFSLLIKLYIIIFTGTPFLIQLFFIYYGFGQLTTLYANYWLLSLLSHPWLCAIIALALNSAAYSTQLFIGSIRTISSGQWQACTALGMNKKQSLGILMPLAIKKSLRLYTNEIILVFKSTSLVYTITIMDIMGYSKFLYGRSYDLLVFLAAGVIYFCVNSILLYLMNIFTKNS